MSDLAVLDEDEATEELTVECDTCSDTFTEGDGHETPDGTVCDGCYENYYSCDDCDDVVHSDSAQNTPNGVACESCYDEYWDTCEDCSEVASKDDMAWTLGDDRRICDGCRDNNYSYCEDCDGYYHYDDSEEHRHNDCECEAPEQTFTIRNDGQEPLKNDTRVRITLPSGTIDGEGMNKIRRLVYDSLYVDSDYETANSARECVVEVGPVWQQKDGNFTKRLSRAIWKKVAKKVNPSLISEIGNIGAAHSVAVDFDVEITRNLNLSAEEFGHEDSCWWQSYSESRCALKSNGGFGLRSFDQYGEVSGRAWVLPVKRTEYEAYGTVNKSFEPTLDTETPDAFVIFNGYGALGGYSATRIIAHMAGLTYRKIAFSCSPMYVNGDSGYLVAPEELASEYTDGSLYMSISQHASLAPTVKVPALV